MTSIPRLDVFDLATHRRAVHGAVAVADLPRLAESLREATGELRYELRGHTDAHRRPAATLRLRGQVVLTCDRCSGPLVHELASEQGFFFVSDERELEALPVDPEAQADPLAGSTSFDLATLVEDEAILALPMSPRHAVCPAGEAPTVAFESAPHPFAALAALKRRG
ncbi:MAG: YceD family protein [Betaproteobacteria bacterium]